MKEQVSQFLNTSLTAFHACDEIRAVLLANGFRPLLETEDWAICEDGKYFVERNGSDIIAFTIGGLDDFSYKIVASHVDSPALKLKENALIKTGAYATLNVEKYGGAILPSFYDRRLKIAGRVIKRADGTLRSETVTSPYFTHIPSLPIHQNRSVNEGVAVNPQIDMQPLYALNESAFDLDELANLEENEQVVSYDLFLVNADMPYSFGKNNEFFASPRIDNLINAYASIQALVNHGESGGICVAALLDNEEVGSLTAQGADGDFLENVLRRIAYSLRFDDNEYYKALASSFLLSADNGHALHPNHPEKTDLTNKPTLGGGVLIKNHANKAYITDGLSSAIVKTIFDKADVRYQAFFNRSDMQSGSTLGAAALRHTSMRGADIGLCQLAMHSACECCAASDYDEMEKGLAAFYATNLSFTPDGVIVK